MSKWGSAPQHAWTFQGFQCKGDKVGAIAVHFSPAIITGLGKNYYLIASSQFYGRQLDSFVVVSCHWVGGGVFFVWFWRGGLGAKWAVLGGNVNAADLANVKKHGFRDTKRNPPSMFGP